MSKDLNKGISGIQYNSLNLPRMMDIKSSQAEARNEYTYSAGGQKLRVLQKWNSNFSRSPVIGSAINAAALNVAKTTDYVGNLVYENGALKRILVDGGYIEGTTYHYYLTDHLGNNRVVVNSAGTVIQKNHYYPFGTAFADTPKAEQGKQPYKYNGKELDDLHGLNLYDYSARYYESAVGRFTSVDPLAEKYYSISPYAYVMNNPIKFIDPDGRKIVPVGSAKFVEKANTTFAYMKEKGSWDGVMSSLDERSEDIYIREMSSSFGSFNDTESMNIYWDPTTIIETDTGAKLSPATVLIHESDHKLKQLQPKGPEEQKRDKKIPSKEIKGANKEEERVIRGSEQKAAIKHGEIKEGEVTRNDYKSKAKYKTDDPTSNKPKEDENK